MVNKGDQLSLHTFLGILIFYYKYFKLERFHFYLLHIFEGNPEEQPFVSFSFFFILIQGSITLYSTLLNALIFIHNHSFN